MTDRDRVQGIAAGEYSKARAAQGLLPGVVRIAQQILLKVREGV